MGFEHASYVQILHGYQGVVFAEISCEYMRNILADFGNASMLLCQGTTGLLAVRTTQLAAGFLPL